MPRNLRCVVFLVLMLCMVAFLTSCGSVGAAPISGLGAISGVSVQITPPSITVGTNSITAFTATVNGSGVQAVQWQVNGLTGGAAAIGTIDTSGNYTAPQFVPIPANVTITAIANADNTQSGNASVNITGTQYPATVYMSPTGTAYVQTGTPLQLSAGITGPADTGVVWEVNGVTNGNFTVGTIAPGANGSAVYTAPTKMPNPPNVTISAVSHAEPNRFNSVTVALSDTPPTIATVTVSPALAVVQSQTNFPFNATVINASDPSVSWEVNGSMGGDSTFGTIASEAADEGVYTAPISVPQQGSLVTAQAISNAQPSRSAHAGVVISPPPANGVSVTVSGGTSLPVQSSEIVTATVNSVGLGQVTNPNVTWEVNGVPGGNSTYGTLQPVQGDNSGNEMNYFSPMQVPAQNTVVVQAISQQDSKIVGSLPITITPVIVNVIVETPAGQSAIRLGVGQMQQFNAVIPNQENQNAIWYVCANSQSCVLNGNTTLGTISPTAPGDSIQYTAPNTIPNPATVIIKAVSQANPKAFGQATVTIQQQPVITVEVTPSAPQQVETGESTQGFTANVYGSPDQNISVWNVCTSVLPQMCYPFGNSTYGTMVQDPAFPTEEDFVAPGQVPNPATVYIEAVPEADQTVVSNAVPITIVPFEQQQTVTVEPQYGVILPSQADTVNYSVMPGPDQTVNWSLQLTPAEGGGDCTSQPLVCGTMNPTRSDGAPSTYMPPASPPQDPWYVNITATSPTYNVSGTAQVEITKEATTSISIQPPTYTIQAGSGDFVNFTVTIVNGEQDQNVDWTLQCASEAPNNEWCGDPFGNGAWTGCIEGTDGQKQCESGSLDEPGNTPMQYTPPPKTGNVFNANACIGQPGGPDMIPLSVAISTDSNNCGVDTCTATACITILPAGSK
ncbi:MAG TPA: hypothetical protein VMB18_12625 [Terriglobales bacterium]|nr:hypothetical protein [Terriglobales bacterium]